MNPLTVMDIKKTSTLWNFYCFRNFNVHIKYISGYDTNVVRPIQQDQLTTHTKLFS